MAVCCNRKHCFCQSVLTCKEIILTPIWGDLYNNIVYVWTMDMLFWKKVLVKIRSNRMSVDLCDRNRFGISPHFTINYSSVYVPCRILLATLHGWHQYERFCRKVIAKLRIKIRGRWTEEEWKNRMTTSTEWLNVL